MHTHVRTRTGRRRAAMAVLAAMAALGTMAMPSAQAEQPANGRTPASAEARADAKAEPGTRQEVWRADFDGDAGTLPSGDDWILDTGTGYDGGPANWGTGEVQTYTDDPANIQLDGEGHLKITALKDGDTWTSGRIETKRTDFAAPEGGTLRIEASLSLPDVSGDEALGYWPAFWTLGDEYRGNYWNWPGIGEFDIMENVNGAPETHGVLHCGENPGGPCNETEGVGNHAECGGTCKGGFHEYALELDRSGATEELRWLQDGQVFHTVTEDQVGADAWQQATGHGHFVLLNLAMGGAFPDGASGQATPTAATKPGASLLVDHVSVQTTTGGSAK